AQAVLAVVVRRTARTQAVARAADSVKAFADLVERHPVLDFGGRFGRSEACPSAGLRSMSNGWGASGTMRSGASPLVPCRRIHSVSSESVLRGRWLMGDLLSRLREECGNRQFTPIPPARPDALAIASPCVPAARAGPSRLCSTALRRATSGRAHAM